MVFRGIISGGRRRFRVIAQKPPKHRGTEDAAFFRRQIMPGKPDQMGGLDQQHHAVDIEDPDGRKESAVYAKPQKTEKIQSFR